MVSLDTENIVIYVGCGILGVCSKYFFDRWNAAADKKPVPDEEKHVTEQVCRHRMNNCLNVCRLDNQKAELHMEQMSQDIHTIKVLLFAIAEGKVIPEQLKDLIREGRT